MQTTPNRIFAESDHSKFSSFDSSSETTPVLALPPGRASLSVFEAGSESPLIALPPGRTGVARSVCRILRMRT